MHFKDEKLLFLLVFAMACFGFFTNVILFHGYVLSCSIFWSGARENMEKTMKKLWMIQRPFWH